MPILCSLFLLALATASFAARADDDGVPLDHSRFEGRPLLADFTAGDCPDNPRGLDRIKGNLYHHTTGAGLAIHSGFVLITQEGALIVDPP